MTAGNQNNIVPKKKKSLKNTIEIHTVYLLLSGEVAPARFLHNLPS